MWWIILGVSIIIVSIAVVCIVRASKFNETKVYPCNLKFYHIDADKASKSLSEMIKIPTVSVTDGNYDTHNNFLELLISLYPNTFNMAEVEMISRTLIVRIKGERSDKPTALLAHHDVVPATDGEWDEKPFSGKIENGVIWGRGTLDTKGSLCAILEAVEGFMHQDYMPKNDLYIISGGDEEIGGSITKKAVEVLKTRGIKFELVLDEGGAIVENIFPGVKKPIAVVGITEKGLTNLKLEVLGSGGHASTPSKNNPVNVLARALTKIEKKPMKMEISTPVREMFNACGKQSTFAIKIIFANLWLFKPLVIALFKKLGGETNAMLTTTFAFTQISGSKAANVLPQTAEAILNVRINTGYTIDDCIAHLNKVIADDRVKISSLISGNPSDVSSTGSEAYQMVESTICQTFGDVVVSPYCMLAASDSRHFCCVSENVLRFTPFALSKGDRGSIHAANEKISVETLAKCVEFYIRLIEKL